MTFYEAALRILEESGAPLHSEEITKRAIEKGMLSHIGKTPEVTMLARLAAMTKRSAERRLSVTAKDTFALTEWMLVEDPAALDLTGVFAAHPEDGQPPLRNVERHPEPHSEYLRAIGRQADRKRRDDDTRKKSYPPIAEVVFEVLQEAGALAPAELLARLKQRDLVNDDLNQPALIEGLASDNQRRLDESRRPNFSAVRSESGELQLSTEVPGEGGPSPLEAQQAFCSACGLKFENGRVVLRSESRTQATATPSTPVAISSDDVGLVSQVRHVVKDARRAMARIFRKRLTELDSGTFERSVSKMLHGLGFRELKTSRRTAQSLSFTAKKRDGSLELRYLIRVLRGNVTVERKHVQEVKRDLGHHGTNLGILVSVGDIRGDARAEALSGSPIFLWCADGLADKFLEAEVGVKVMRAELFELDEEFFLKAKADADDAQRRRDERHETKSFDAPDKSRPSAPAQETVALAPVNETPALAAPSVDGSEGDDDQPEDGAPGGEETAESKGRKRRRRRRRNRGPGSNPAAPGAPVDGAAVQVAADGTTPDPAPNATESVPTQPSVASQQDPKPEGES